MRSTRLAVTAVLVAGLGGLTALAQRQPGGGFGGGAFGALGPAQLVNSKTVHQELKVTEEQATKLREWSREFGSKQMERMREAFTGGQPDRERIAEIQAELSKEAWQQVGDVLKEEQVNRLKQIEVQVAGLQAFALPRVKDALKITDDQQEKIRDIQRSSGKEIMELREEFGLKGFGGGFGGPKLDADKQAEYDRKLAAINKDAMTQVEGVLTDDQKKAWKELTGASVDTAVIRREATPAFGGPGGGGQFKKKKKDD
jgi:hypothetical protein